MAAILLYKTIKRRPCWLTKPIPELGIFFASGIGNREIWNPEYSSRNPKSPIDWNPESSWTLSSCRNFLLFHEMYIAAGHVNEKERFPPNSEMRPLQLKVQSTSSEINREVSMNTCTHSHYTKSGSQDKKPQRLIESCCGKAWGTPLRYTGPWLFSLFFTWAPENGPLWYG